MFSLSPFEDTSDSSQMDQNSSQKHHVRIPAFKATPASIVRETATTTPSTTSDDGAASAETVAKMKTSSSSVPHVPHEPYKGAVWSKPVRVRGGHTASSSTPRSSKPTSRTSSRLSFIVESVSTQYAHQSDITIPSHSTVSVISPPPAKLAEPRPVSIVSPVRSPSSTSERTRVGATDVVDGAVTVDPVSAAEESVALPAAENGAFSGSTTEALRVEILRLREENRRLHAMRRSSCDNNNRRSGDTLSSSALDDDDSRTEEDVRVENESLKESVKTLNSQLQIQAQVNHDLKKLVIASIGDDLQYRFETISSSRAQLDQEASYLLKSLSDTKEELEKATIECDVWKSKFMASRVMVDGLAAWKAALQLKHSEMERALNLFIEENESLHTVIAATNKNLSQLSSSLRRRYPQIGLGEEDCLSSGSPTDRKRHLLDIGKENRRIAQSLNFEIGALIRVADDRSLGNPSFALGTPPTTNGNKINAAGAVPKGSHLTQQTLPTPASSLAREVLQSETTPPPKLSNDAIAYLDMLFGPDGQPPEFTFKCCENCNGDIKTL